MTFKPTRTIADAELEKKYQSLYEWIDRKRAAAFGASDCNDEERYKKYLQNITALHSYALGLEEKNKHLSNVIDYCSLQMSVSREWLLEQIKESEPK